MEKAREASVPLYMAFIDYKKASDSVKHAKLWKVVKDMGLCSSTVDSLKNLYKDHQATVRVEAEITNWFAISKGVCQRCLVSSLSFSCYSEQVTHESADELTWIGLAISKSNADDTVLIATSPEARQR